MTTVTTGTIEGPRGTNFKMVVIYDTVNSSDTIDTTLRQTVLGAIIGSNTGSMLSADACCVGINSWALLTTTGTYAATVCVGTSVGAASANLNSVTAVFWGR